MSNPPPQGPKRPGTPPNRPQGPRPGGPPQGQSLGRPAAPLRDPSMTGGVTMPGVPPVMAVPPRNAGGDLALGVAVSTDSAAGGTVTARKAGGLRDLGLDVSPQSAGVRVALQHLAKAINVAFQSDYGENYLEAVYQAAIVRNGEVVVVHRDYFGYRDNWFGQFGRLLRSMSLTFEGADPTSPEGKQRIAQYGPATLRGLFNLMGRKLDLVAEFEDRVPAYVEQMFDRLEASGIILGWDRDDWDIRTTTIGLDIRITPRIGYVLRVG